MKHVEVADMIKKKYNLIFCNGEFYSYTNGYFQLKDELFIRREVKNIYQDSFSKTKANEVIHDLQADCFVEFNKLNATDLLNLKNGMFDVNKLELLSHSFDYYSTIRLNVEFNKDAKCNLWMQTLMEVFEGEIDKIDLLQQFFGLCLTKEVGYEKALIMIGEGRNGKSVISYVLENLIGDQNRSAVNVEKFNDSHYIANLYNKLINISIETSVKTDIYDAAFKAIVSGDSIEADAKYKKPFMFRPFCKLIISSNNMPRVDDKTDAFFKRLLILRFNRQFDENEQKRGLKHDLLKELDGIYLWSIEGLQRLRNKGYFDINNQVQAEIDAYRRENNNVMLFFDECCSVFNTFEIKKSDLYINYNEWCKGNGFRPFSKIRFSKEFIKIDKGITQYKRNDGWYFLGVTLSEKVNEINIK